MDSALDHYVDLVRDETTSKVTILQIFRLLQRTPHDSHVVVAEAVLSNLVVDLDVLDAVVERWPLLAVEHHSLESLAWSGQPIFVKEDGAGEPLLGAMSFAPDLPEPLELVLYREVTEAFEDPLSDSSFFRLGRALKTHTHMSPELKEAWKAFLPEPVPVEVYADEIVEVWFDLQARVLRGVGEAMPEEKTVGWLSLSLERVKPGRAMKIKLETDAEQRYLAELYSYWTGSHDDGGPIFRSLKDFESVRDNIVDTLWNLPDFENLHHGFLSSEWEGWLPKQIRLCRRGEISLDDLVKSVLSVGEKNDIYFRKIELTSKLASMVRKPRTRP